MIYDAYKGVKVILNKYDLSQSKKLTLNNHL